MKKILIVYAIIFALTIIIPAIVCFSKVGETGGEKEMVTLFRQCISLIAYSDGLEILIPFI